MMQGNNSLYHVRDAAMRLTLARESLRSDVFQVFTQLLDEIDKGDSPDNLVWIYHEFASCVLELDDEVVTGDRWKDHILAIALQSDTIFSRNAARGRRDEVLFRAEMRDLSALERLFRITDENILRWMNARQRVDARSWVRWAAPRHGTDYGQGPIAHARKLLCESDDWSICAQPLWDFFRQHGSGLLLSSNRFVLEDMLYAIPRSDDRLPALEDIWPEYDVLAENAKKLLSGGRGEHILIAAEDGQKFAVQSLLPLHEDLRMIEFAPDSSDPWRANFGLMLREMENLPGANLIYLDMRGQDLSLLRDLPAARRNTALCAAVDDIARPEESIAFLRMPVLPEMDFNNLVERFVRQLDSAIPQEHVRRALRYQKPRQYSIEHAQQVAEDIIQTLALDARKG